METLATAENDSHIYKMTAPGMNRPSEFFLSVSRREVDFPLVEILAHGTLTSSTWEALPQRKNSKGVETLMRGPPRLLVAWRYEKSQQVESDFPSCDGAWPSTLAHDGHYV